MHHLNSKSKRTAMQWQNLSSPSVKELKVSQSESKVILRVFWNSQGALLASFQKEKENVDATSYCARIHIVFDQSPLNVWCKYQTNRRYFLRTFLMMLNLGWVNQEKGSFLFYFLKFYLSAKLNPLPGPVRVISRRAC